MDLTKAAQYLALLGWQPIEDGLYQLPEPDATIGLLVTATQADQPGDDATLYLSLVQLPTGCCTTPVAFTRREDWDWFVHQVRQITEFNRLSHVRTPPNNVIQLNFGR